MKMKVMVKARAEASEACDLAWTVAGIWRRHARHARERGSVRIAAGDYGNMCGDGVVLAVGMLVLGVAVMMLITT